MDTLLTFLQEQGANEIFTAGAIFAAVAAALFVAVRLARGLTALFWRTCSWSVVVDNQFETYGRLLAWLAHEGAFKRLRRVRLDEFYLPQSADDDDWEEDEVTSLRALLTPDAGVCWLRRDGVYVRLDRFIDDKPIPGRLQRAERLSLTFLLRGPKSGAALFDAWRREADVFAQGAQSVWPRLYTLNQYGWSYGMRIRPRPLSTVVLKGDAGERLVADARRFFARETWYAERAVPWRRGYLLYGPTGTGKTSLIRAAASELGLDLALVDLSKRWMDDGELRDALATAPRKAAIVLEDIDAAFKGRERGEAALGLTFSGLLNALDGLAAQEGRIVFMTTNRKEMLDPALVRPGRADLHLRIGYAGPAEAAALYARFFPGEEMRTAGIAALPDAEIAPAAIQAELLASDEDPAAAARAIRALFEAPAAAEG